MSSFYLWRKRLPRPFGPRNDIRISASLCLSAFVAISQFEKTKPICDDTNLCNILIEKGLRQYTALRGIEKQSQFKAKLKRNEGFITYGARDCHGPSGLAMTFVSLLLCDSVPLRIPQSLP